MTRLLFADDSEDLRHLAGVVFDHTTWDLTTVRDGQEALDVWAADDFDIVVLDVRMPGTNGVDVARQIREGGFEGPIVLWTSWEGMVPAVDAVRLDIQVLPKLDVTVLRTFVNELRR